MIIQRHLPSKLGPFLGNTLPSCKWRSYDDLPNFFWSSKSRSMTWSVALTLKRSTGTVLWRPNKGLGFFWVVAAVLNSFTFEHETGLRGTLVSVCIIVSMWCDLLYFDVIMRLYTSQHTYSMSARKRVQGTHRAPTQHTNGRAGSVDDQKHAWRSNEPFTWGRRGGVCVLRFSEKDATRPWWQGRWSSC